jgi:hypothetical protein
VIYRLLILPIAVLFDVDSEKVVRGLLGANFGETEKRRISVSAEIRAEKFLAAEIIFFGSNPKFGRNSASAKNILCIVT